MQAIRECVNDYFLGTYHGDAKQIKNAFHPDAEISGILKGQYYAWTLDEFIQRVTTAPTSAAKNEKFDKQILLLDQTSDAAMVKARVVVGDLVFTDYITLLKIDGKWVIRNKSFIA
jgi:hypothetical protein